MTGLAPTPLASLAEDPVAALRLKGRLAVSFLLDFIAIVRGEGHVLDTLLVSAIIQANIQDLIRRPDLLQAFAQDDELPTDEMRRPVSMNALASSLQIPFETVRRRVTTLVRLGYCQFVEGGVIVPSAVLAQPQYQVDAFHAFERLRAFYYQLSELGLLRDLPSPAASLPPGVFPVRTVARLVGSYILRVVEAVGAVEDMLDGLIILAIFRSNVENLALDLPGPGRLVDDADRTPISVIALAARLGVPQETIRRHVRGLLARGSCVRMRGGLIIPAQALTSTRLRSTLEANVSNLQRLFTALAQIGVLEVWDSIRPPPKAWSDADG
ncbi:MAG: DeoR family transcriptional regulator [Phenylobacterium sp.]